MERVCGYDPLIGHFRQEKSLTQLIGLENQVRKPEKDRKGPGHLNLA